MLCCIKNSQKVKKSYLEYPKKKSCEQLLDALWNENLISGYYSLYTNFEKFHIILKYDDNYPAITNIKFISKPGKRVYLSVKQLSKINENSGVLLLSTNNGILSSTECKKLNVGGEALVLVN